MAETPLPLISLLQVGRGSRTPPHKGEDGASPGDKAEGCPRSQSAIRRERGHHNQLVAKHI